jgi:streptomycin 6-kinase
LPDGGSVVLKVGAPDREFFTEVDALRLYDGRWSVRLRDFDLDLGAMLLERVSPGESLVDVHDDLVVVPAVAGVMRRLWRPVPATHWFPTIDDWVGKVAKKAERPEFAAFPRDWLARALALHAGLAAMAAEPVVLHGDLHQGNVLSAAREPWLAIDPKGVVGERVWETGPLLINDLPPVTSPGLVRAVHARRIDLLSQHLGMDRPRIARAALVRLILSLFWTLEDQGTGWESRLGYADVFAELASVS